MRHLLLAAGILCALAASARAEGRTGDFDFYVLALSWSPSYCAAEGERADRLQCAGSRPYEFVVHGLWPQYERGYPEYCDRSAPHIPRRTIDSMLDLMPSPRLVIHQWRKHGVCATKEPVRYFNELREARERIAIPPEFVNINTWRMVAPGAVESAFLRVNSGLAANGVSVTCDGKHLREVRVCMTRDFDFRPCPELERSTCRARSVAMPPSR